jgi:hypothetical protein
MDRCREPMRRWIEEGQLRSWAARRDDEKEL